MNGRLARVRGLKRTLATTLTVAGSTLIAFGFATGSFAAPSGAYVITATKAIDGYRVGSTYVAAVRQFGGPKSSSQDAQTCVARWSNRVTIAWHRRWPYAKWSKACLNFAWANVAGSKWRTDKGLRVGATRSQVKKLYKAAKSEKSGGYTVWTLTRSSGNTLQAWVKGGKISYFRLVHT
jgi:hypothetical protein